MRCLVIVVLAAALLIIPGLAGAQSAGTTPTAPKPEAQAQSPAPPCAGTTCPAMPTPATTEKMKQMQGQMGPGCCPAPASQGCPCPMCQQVKRQLNDLQQRVEALEKQVKGKRK